MLLSSDKALASCGPVELKSGSSSPHLLQYESIPILRIPTCAIQETVDKIRNTLGGSGLAAESASEGNSADLLGFLDFRVPG